MFFRNLTFFRFAAALKKSFTNIDDALAEEAWRLLEEYADKLWSHVDATSFALMAREGSTTAFAFDHHFVQRGLQVVPGSYARD